MADTINQFNGGNGGSDYCFINRDFSLTNSDLITHVCVYVSTNANITLKIVKRNSAGNYDIAFSQAVSTGSPEGYKIISLNPPYRVPASGEYYLGCHFPNGVNYGIASGSTVGRAYYLGNPTGNGVTFTEDAVAAAAMTAIHIYSEAILLKSANGTWDDDNIKSQANATANVLNGVAIGLSWTGGLSQDFPDAGNVRDTDTVAGVSGSLSSNKILQSNATGSGAGNYKDANLTADTVKLGVTYGVSGTGTYESTGISVADIFSGTVGDGTLTLAESMRVLLAGMAGKTSGHPLSPVFTGIHGTSAVISATLDASGNRTAVTVTP